MNKDKKRVLRREDRDTMQSEYDFSKAVRGITAVRYALGNNVVVIPSDVMDVFPNSETVAEALRALAPVIRHQRVMHSKVV